MDAPELSIALSDAWISGEVMITLVDLEWAGCP